MTTSNKKAIQPMMTRTSSTLTSFLLNRRGFLGLSLTAGAIMTLEGCGGSAGGADMSA